jgi:hypothetical protein
MNKCIKNSFNHLRPYLVDGLKELNVPTIEPLKIDQLSMENNAGAVRIKALFTNIIVHGASNYTIKDVRSDFKVNNQFYLIFFYIYFRHFNFFYCQNKKYLQVENNFKELLHDIAKA